MLVRNGTSDWRVSLRPEPSSPERLAARELAKYVRKMSGAKLEVVEETIPSEKAIRIDCDDGVLDGFDLTIMPDGISIHGHTPRGALYGAYQVLVKRRHNSIRGVKLSNKVHSAKNTVRFHRVGQGIVANPDENGWLLLHSVLAGEVEGSAESSAGFAL